MTNRSVALTIALLALPLAAAADRLSPNTLTGFEQALSASSWFKEAPDSVTGKPLHPLLAGASAFAASGVASVDEVVDVGRRRSYQQMSVSGGVRFPLLGSRLRYSDGVIDRQISELTAAADQELKRRDLFARLRRAYVELWSARVRRQLAAEYQSTAPEMESLLLRRTAAAMLLESDRLDFMASFARAASEYSRAAADELSAVAELEALIETPVATVAPPVVEFACSRPTLDQHPELQVLRARATEYASRATATALRAVRSDLRVGVSSSYEPASGDPGKSAFVTLSFDYAFGDAQAERRAARLQYSRADSEYRLRRAQLEIELMRLLQTRRALESGYTLARISAAASAARLRERGLRAARLAGDVIEQLQQARYANYRATLAEHLAAREQLEWQIALATFTPSDCGQSESP